MRTCYEHLCQLSVIIPTLNAHLYFWIIFNVPLVHLDYFIFHYHCHCITFPMGTLWLLLWTLENCRFKIWLTGERERNVFSVSLKNNRRIQLIINYVFLICGLDYYVLEVWLLELQTNKVTILSNYEYEKFEVTFGKKIHNSSPPLIFATYVVCIYSYQQFQFFVVFLHFYFNTTRIWR